MRHIFWKDLRITYPSTLCLASERPFELDLHLAILSGWIGQDRSMAMHPGCERSITPKLPMGDWENGIPSAATSRKPVAPVTTKPIYRKAIRGKLFCASGFGAGRRPRTRPPPSGHPPGHECLAKKVNRIMPTPQPHPWITFCRRSPE